MKTQNQPKPTHDGTASGMFYGLIDLLDVSQDDMYCKYGDEGFEAFCIGIDMKDGVWNLSVLFDRNNDKLRIGTSVSRHNRYIQDAEKPRAMITFSKGVWWFVGEKGRVRRVRDGHIRYMPIHVTNFLIPNYQCLGSMEYLGKVCSPEEHQARYGVKSLKYNKYLRDIYRCASVLWNCDKLVQKLERMELAGYFNQEYHLCGLLGFEAVAGVERRLIMDTIKMAKAVGRNIIWKGMGIKGWTRLHDKLMEEKLLKVNTTPLKVHKKYYGLFSTLDAEMISTVGRLRYEGVTQKNCVNSYLESVNSGYCAIYSVIVNSLRYTVEVAERNGELECVQIRGACNSMPEKDVLKLISTSL